MSSEKTILYGQSPTAGGGSIIISTEKSILAPIHANLQVQKNKANKI